MAIFRYQALSADQQTATGELEADSVQQAIAQLEAAGLTIQSIGYAEASTASAAPHAADAQAHDETTARGIPRSAIDIEQTVLRSHMAQILERGRAIAPALRAYAEEMPPGYRRRQLRTVCNVLERGDATEATVELIALPDYWIPLLSAATSSADPGRVLHDFLAETERADNLRRQRWKSLAYPFVVGCLALAVMTMLSIFVIPAFREIFEEFDLNLPALTLFLLNVAWCLSSPWLLLVVALLVGCGVLLFSAYRLRRFAVGAWLADRFSFPIGRRNAIARFAQFTADLLVAGLQIPDALRIAGFTVNRNRLRRAAWCLANDMDSGKAIESEPPPIASPSPPMRSFRLYMPSAANSGGEYPSLGSAAPLTATVVRAVRSEMPMDTRVCLLREISACHAERARRAFSWTTGLLEPFAICAVGLVVGMTVLALFLPLIKLIDGLSH